MTKFDNDERDEGTGTALSTAGPGGVAKGEVETPDAALADWVELPLPRQSLFSPYVLSQRKVRVWELVLHSQHIPHRVLRRGRTHRIMVHHEDTARALDEITAYERENRNWPPQLPKPTPLRNIYPTLFGLLVLALFHALTNTDIDLFGHSPVEWFELGAAHSYKIRAGQWWRIVTALTLHSSDQHLLGNVVIGGAFILFVCSELGAGLGWSAILLSGILGNLANALTRTALHLSVGASTASFGAVGILVGLRFFDSSHSSWRRWVVPLAGGVGLMAMLGTGGERTDLGAHYLGLAAGVVLGALVGIWMKVDAKGPGLKLKRALAILPLAVPALAWLAALVLTK